MSATSLAPGAAGPTAEAVLQDAILTSASQVDKLVADAARDDKAKVDELFLWCFARKPTQVELETALAHIAKAGPPAKKAAYENILWALLNTKEFVFID